MSFDTESFKIAFRVSDKQFVVRDKHDKDVFAGDYTQVESWLDHQDNRPQPISTAGSLDSETDIAEEVLKATRVTQEMMDKALSAEPKPTTLRSRLFGRKKSKANK